MPGISYESSQQNFNTPSVSPAASTTTEQGGGGIWGSVLSSLPGILTGTAAIVAATKAGEGGGAYYGPYTGAPAPQGNNNMLLWLGAGILAIAALFFFLKK